MTDSSLNLLGFHATHPAAAEAILLCKQFCPSLGEREWLGDGVYFFQDDLAPALWWGSGRCAGGYRVLQASIIVAKDALFDLTIQANLQTVQRTIEQIAKKAATRGVRVSAPLDGAAINWICVRVAPGIKVVRGNFQWPTAQTNLGLSRLTLQHVQLAVRDCSCICDICAAHKEVPPCT